MRGRRQECYYKLGILPDVAALLILPSTIHTDFQNKMRLERERGWEEREKEGGEEREKGGEEREEGGEEREN